MKLFFNACSIIGIIFLQLPLQADNNDFFQSDSVVSIVIEAPISKLTRQRGPDPDWMEGFVHYSDKAGNTLTFDVEIRARGDFRRKKSSCDFPPYMVNFKKSEVKGSLFDGLDKVKIVSHCRDKPKTFKGYIYKEYLAYKTYNILTESSFKVRLLSVHYVNPGRESSGEPEVAFMIESIDSLAKRHKGSEISSLYALPSAYIPEALCMADLFEYFLGNTDFSFVNGEEECCHNAKVVQTPNGLIPIPYDFDITGMVDVPYAVINSRLPIKSLQERFFRGMKTSDEVLQKTLKRYIDKKEEILSLWSDNEYLTERDRDTALKFILEFYDVIEDPEKLQNEIIARMRNAEKLESILLEKYVK